MKRLLGTDAHIGWHTYSTGCDDPNDKNYKASAERKEPQFCLGPKDKGTDVKGMPTKLGDEVMSSCLQAGNTQAQCEMTVTWADVAMEPGWDDTPTAIDSYKKQWIRSHYKNLLGAMANHRIDKFQKEKAFGDNTKFWAQYLKIYVRDAMGYQSTFPEYITESIKQGDPLKLKNTLYYNMSDQRIIQAFDKLESSFAKHGVKLPFMNNVPQITEKSGKARKDQVEARKEYLSRMIHNMGKLEARYQLMTLLANTGTATANLFGGTTMTISQGGMRNFMRTNSNKWLVKNLLTDKDGKFQIKLEDGSFVKDKKTLKKWIGEQGVIDNFIADELLLNSNLKNAYNKNTKNFKSFFKEWKNIIKQNPDVSNETILELAKRYGIQDALTKYGAFFMQASERKLRTDAFLTHALQFRDAYGKFAQEMRLDDPAVIAAGLRGVEATQFLYHSAFRPAYMRTSLGKVMTRFKLFAFQSVRTRKELYRRAKYYGYKPGTPEFEKFKDLMVADLMTMALGGAFMYSLFDTALPPPYDWIQESSEWLFGDKAARKKAFFGQYPYPIAPLNVITPPAARLLMNPLTTMINGDWERFMDYHIHTMYPFGRVVRNIDKTIYDKDSGKYEMIKERPYGTTLGRFSQQFFRLPLDKVTAKYDKAQLAEERKRLIEQELGE